MPDSTLVIQILAFSLFIACVYHSWVTEGRRAAQQWFIIGYIFAMLLINFLVTIGQILYAPEMLPIGAAPSLTIMLIPSVTYLAYSLARSWTDPDKLRTMAFLIFLLTPSIMLPIDAAALYFRWWTFPSESLAFLNGVPFYLPFAWGVIGAGFYLMVERIRKIRFRGNGQLFAMMIAAPLLAIVLVLVAAILQVVIDTLAVIGGDTILYALLGLLFVVLPLALTFNVPRPQKS